MSRPAGLGWLVLVSLVAAARLAAQTVARPADPPTGGRIARSAALTGTIAVDGKLDEPGWKLATPIAEFVQRDPREGAPSTERTEVRFLTDGEALYIGAWLFDREPGGIVRGERLRDVTLTNSDYFAVILDTYLDRQNGFVFATTPAGVEYDGQVVREGEGGGVFQQGQTRAQAGSAGGFNLNWDATWKVATSVDSLGWYAEFRIPFSTLPYGGSRVQRWGLNLARSIRRRNEEAFWAPIPRQFSLYRLSRAGVLDGLQVPSQRVATVTPYVLGSASRTYAPGPPDTDYPTEVGADAKLGLTPSLTLDLTYNTDFAQVEVDEQRTNLTRFPLFFPEKRPFFLENAGMFSAGTPQAVELFFSRRVGIDTLGHPVPIVGGGRLTGRVAGLTVGLLQIFTERITGTQPANSYSVGRAAREFGRRSRVGVIGVQRIATTDGGDHNRTYGADGRLGLSDRFTVDWWAAHTETPNRSGRDVGFSARLGYQTKQWDNSLRFSQVGEAFNPEVGFVNRVGYRYYEGSLFRTVPVHGSKLLRYWMPHFNYRGYYGFDGELQTDQVHIDLGEMMFQNGGRFGPELNVFGEDLIVPFRIADTVLVPVGHYRWVNLGWDIQTNPSAPVSMVMRLDFGELYNGRRNGGSGALTVREGSALTTSLLVDYQNVHLDQGDFRRTLVGFRLGYYFTPRIFLQSLLQYNNQADVFSANVRFAWLNTAGTGLFVVLNDAEQSTGLLSGMRPQARSFVVKFTKQLGGT